MKKMKMLFLVAATALTAMFTTSCDKELTSTPLSFDNLDSASLRLYPKANLDLTSAGNEALPEGSAVTVTIAYDEYSFAGTGGAASTSIVLNGTVNADGFVEFRFPVDDDGVLAVVTIDGFEFEQVQADGGVVNKFYNFGTFSRTVTLGAVSIYEVETATIATIDESSTLVAATLVGNITCELNLQTAGNEPAPAGTIVIISKDGSEAFETEVTLDANGQFSLEVQVNIDGTDDFTVETRPFVVDQVQAAGSTPETKSVEFSATTIGGYTSIAPGQTKTVNQVLGTPTVIDPDPAVEMVTISGVIYTELDGENEDDDFGFNVREEFEDQTFTFFTTAADGVVWSEEVDTDGDGKYQVEVPAGQTVYLSCVIEAERNVFDAVEGEFVDSNWRLEVAMSDNFTVTGAVTFDQGGKDVGSLTGAELFTWVQVVEL